MHSTGGFRTLLLLVTLSLTISACGPDRRLEAQTGTPAVATDAIRPIASPTISLAVASALDQTEKTTSYDPAYVTLDYPGGDVPIETGVCSDVVVRALRSAGVDLQKEVHEDMRASFSSYPKLWGAKAPDRNIDHRRVANLMAYFERRSASLPITSSADDYRPGDVVAWRLDNGRLHVGLVTNVAASGGGNQVVHNIGAGARLEDVLFAWEIIGHYRPLE